ncbi:MFS general substrate transporter [Thozetella sp. PMI_491]|nr:MFS general substrate transporter [Thozetella sp. PMI_491]
MATRTSAVEVKESAPKETVADPEAARPTDESLVDPEIAKYAADQSVHVDEETNRRLKRLIDKRILAVMIVTSFFQTLDKGAISYASIMGIVGDAGLVGQQYSWLTTAAYIAIVCVEYPTTWVIQRASIAKYLAANIILRGITLTLHSVCKSFAALVALRIVLGIAEACSQPTFVLLSALWYKREEQAAAIVYWLMMNGLSATIGGLLAYAFSNIPSSPALKSWQALFLAYGILTVCWGVFVLYWMPDSPMRAKCFSEDDKKLMIERVRDNKTGIQNRKFRKEQFIEAFRDPQTYAFAIIQICTTLPSGGVGAFSSILVRSFGYDVLQTQLLQMPVGVLLIIIMLSAAYIDRKFQRPTLAMLASILPSIAATVVFLTVPQGDQASRVGLLLAYYIIFSFWACSGLALPLVTRNVAGQTKKATVVGTNFVCWALGNAVGPQTFRSEDAPRYVIAFSTIMGCWVALIITVILLREYYKAQNRARDRLLASGQIPINVSLMSGFEDITDKENPHFRYMY